MNRVVFLLSLLFLPMVAWAEGRCPPGQYPIGGPEVGGCAPIPGGQSMRGEPSSPKPTGKWETRWGAIAQDTFPIPGAMLSIGVSESKPSRREAASFALSQCEEAGGRRCKLLMEYHNQCVALAGPIISEYKAKGGATYSSRAPTESEAKSSAIDGCEKLGQTQRCDVIYAACSMSEFKSFR